MDFMFHVFSFNNDVSRGDEKKQLRKKQQQLLIIFWCVFILKYNANLGCACKRFNEVNDNNLN